MNYIIAFTNNFIILLNAMSLYIILGLFFAGILKQLIPKDFVSSHLGDSTVFSVFKATLFGIPLPLCSCSVIPMAQALRKEGANKGAVQSFLISTPITGVDSILATFSFFGLFFTFFRVVCAVIIALCVGLLQILLFKEKKIIKNKFSVRKKDKDFKISYIKTNFKKSENKFCFKNVFVYAYSILFKDMAKALLLGLFLAATFLSFIPKEYSSLLFENQFLTYIVVILFAMPLYTCATASLPIAAAMMLQGMSAGAAFIFLSAGPATSLVTMSVVYKILGKSSLILYLLVISILSLFFGYLFDLFFFELEILNINLQNEETSKITILSSSFMFLMMLYYVSKELFSKKK